jgi:hypothetical protein
MLSNKFSNEDLWKGIILFGLNAATYKMAKSTNALSQIFVQLSGAGHNHLVNSDNNIDL